MLNHETKPANSEEIELQLLLSAVQQKCGYDLSEYAQPMLRRRLASQLAQSGKQRLSELIPLILWDQDFPDQLLRQLSITVTEMFRDPVFFQFLRSEVIPSLPNDSPIKIWVAGCATGEEAYSLAILLTEAGVIDRVQIYATDFNSESIHAAEAGVYPLKSIRQATANYLKSGGAGCFSDFYHAEYGFAKIAETLKEHIRFCHHDLAVDGAFGEMNLVLSRNVLIYFGRRLQDRALRLFHDSLVPNGHLCLGAHESVEFSTVNHGFESVGASNKVYRRMVDEASSGACTTSPE